MTVWDAPGAEKALRAAMSDGLSGRAIAGRLSAEMGTPISRSAVIGKIRRLRLAAGWAGADARAPRGRRISLLPATDRMPKLEEPDFDAPDTIAAHPRPWLTRRPGECAWPADGDGAFVRSCCNPIVAGRAYCAGHVALAYRAPAEPGPPTAARRA